MLDNNVHYNNSFNNFVQLRLQYILINKIAWLILLLSHVTNNVSEIASLI